MRLTDLREILRYVPRFRDQLFVIALDGAVVEDENFRNLLLDIALLRSLRIGVVLVHGAAHQIRRLAEVTEHRRRATSTAPASPTRRRCDWPCWPSSRVSHELLEGLVAPPTCAGRSATPSSRHPAGILQGVDHQFTGKVERVDTGLLQALLENGHRARHPAGRLRRRGALASASTPTPSPSRWRGRCRRSS